MVGRGRWRWGCNEGGGREKGSTLGTCTVYVWCMSMGSEVLVRMERSGLMEAFHLTLGRTKMRCM